MGKQFNIVHSTSALIGIEDAEQTLTDAGFILVSTDDVLRTISAPNQVVPNIIILDTDTSLAVFVRIQTILNEDKNLRRSRLVLFDSTDNEIPSKSHRPNQYYHLPKPKAAEELLSTLLTLCETEEILNHIEGDTLKLEQTIAFFEGELNQSRFEELSLIRQLRKERDRLDSSQAVARTGSWETDLKTFDVQWTEQTHRIFGTDPSSFQPTHEKFLAMIHPEDREKIDAAFAASLADTTPHSIVHRIIRQDGEVRIVEERWSVLPNAKGELDHAVGSCRDITAQILAEEDRNRLFQLSGDLLTINTFGGILTQVNPAWTKVLGWQKEELENLHVLKIIHPDDHESTKAVIGSLTTGESLKDFENRFLCKDGSYRWICWNCHPLLDSQQIFSIGRDITESKVAKQGQQELEERIQFMLSAANMGYWDLDLLTMRTWRSLSHDQCFGYDTLLPEWSYETFLAHIHPDDREFVDRSFQTAQSGGTSYRVEFRAIWPDESMHWLFSIGRFTRNSEGDASRVAGVVLDISDRKLLEEQLSQAQRLESMGQLTGGIAHDFNNLLTVIIGNAEVLKEDLADNEVMLGMAEMVLSAAERGSELIKRMLAFARKQRLEPKTININELVRSLLPLLELSLGEFIEIDLQLEQEPWLCRIDPTELESSVLNLSINARDAMSNRGKLWIETSNETLDLDDQSKHPDLPIGDYVRILVKDNGSGISDESLAQIFEPFFTTKSNGSGLGLAMVYGFIKQSGGNVYVHSRVEQGTSIELYIPAIHQSSRQA